MKHSVSRRNIAAREDKGRHEGDSFRMAVTPAPRAFAYFSQHSPARRVSAHRQL
jgi:hypothetical protein